MADDAPEAPRICPGCQSAMQHFLARKVEIDRCFFCGGVYLDQGELETIAGGPVDAGDPGPPGKRICAGCKTPLAPQRLGKVTADRCPGCGGVYLDQGELERIAGELKIAPEAPEDQPDAVQFRCPGCGQLFDVDDGIATAGGLACVDCAGAIDEFEGTSVLGAPMTAGVTMGPNDPASAGLRTLSILFNGAGFFNH